MTGGILLVSLLLLGLYKPFQQYIQIPSSITLFEGEEETISKSASVAVSGASTNVNTAFAESEQAVSLQGMSAGEDELILELAGLPIKKVDVNVLKDFKVLPGGQSIGVKLNTLGVLVVGHHLVASPKEKISPGEDAGIKVGDIITKINGKKINSMAEVGPYVEEAGKKGKALQFTVQRGQEKFDTSLKPILDDKTKSYKLGLYIRDSAAGIGTMTFIEPKSKKYGALGHVISDMDTKNRSLLKTGKL